MPSASVSLVLRVKSVAANGFSLTHYITEEEAFTYAADGQFINVEAQKQMRITNCVVFRATV
jgi:hypothetical protein